MIYRPPRSDHPQPTRQRAAVIAAKSAKLRKVVFYERQENFLKEIVDTVRRWFRMMKRESLLDRVVDQSRILPNERIPCGLLTLRATFDESFFLFGHKPGVFETRLSVGVRVS
jgi:hypothetical protein